MMATTKEMQTRFMLNPGGISFPGGRSQHTHQKSNPHHPRVVLACIRIHFRAATQKHGRTRVAQRPRVR